MTKYKIYAVILGASLLLIGASVMGLRINITQSLPTGIYWEVGNDIAKGKYVLANFKEQTPTGYRRGYSAGTRYMGKQVVAVPGDRVQATDQGIVVNGRLVDQSKVSTADSQGRTLVAWEGDITLKEGEYFLMGDNNISYDSRYFGPVGDSLITSELEPIIVFSRE